MYLRLFKSTVGGPMANGPTVGNIRYMPLHIDGGSILQSPTSHARSLGAVTEKWTHRRRLPYKGPKKYLLMQGGSALH